MRVWVRLLRHTGAAGLLALLVGQNATAAEAVVVRAAQHPEHGRLVLDFDNAVEVQHRSEPGSLILRFDRALAVDLGPAREKLKTSVKSMSYGTDGRSLAIKFRPGHGLKSLRQFEPDLVVVDIAATAGLGPARDREDVGVVDVRVGDHPRKKRLVIEFDAPMQHLVLQQEPVLEVRFGHAVDLEHGPIIHALGQDVEAVSGLTNGEPGLRIDPAEGVATEVFGLGDRLVVIDIYKTADPANGIRAKAPAQQEVAPSGPASDAVATANQKSRIEDSEKTVSVVAEKAQVEAAPHHRAQSWPDMSLRQAADGAEIDIGWDENTHAAVFRRGLTLWLVFDRRTSASWELPHVGRALSHVLRGIELVGAGDGRPSALHTADATVVRISMSRPYEPRVWREGFVWKVRLGMSSEPGTSVPIERSGTPSHLRMVGEGAADLVELQDHLVGDRLFVWPLAAAGVGSRKRTFVDVSFLETAQGIAFRLLSDPIEADVRDGGLVIGADRGLLLSAEQPSPGSWPNASLRHGEAVAPPSDDSRLLAAPAGESTAVGTEPIDRAMKSSTDDVLSENAELAPQGRTAGQHVDDVVMPASRHEASKPHEGERPEAIEGALRERPPHRAVDRGVAAARPPLALDHAGLKEGESLSGRRASLMQAVARAAEEDRPEAELELARFLLTQALATETLAALNGDHWLRNAERPSLDIARRGLNGAAELLMGRLPAAAANLGAPALDRDPEVALWRAALAAARSEWDRAAEELGRSEPTLGRYPPLLQLKLGLPAAMILVEEGRPEEALAILDRIQELSLHPRDEARVGFVRALAHARIGHVDEALREWTRVERLPSEETRIKAAFTRINTLQEHGRIKTADALAQLRERRPRWRGHPWEARMLDRLGELHVDVGEPVEAVATWRELTERFGESSASMGIQSKIEAAVEEALTEPQNNPWTTLRMLALVEAHPRLLPSGPADHELREPLARWLADIGLVDRAASLFDLPEQPSAEAAQQAAVVADLYLRGEAPNAALAVIDNTEPGVADLDTVGLHDLTRARALMALGRDGEAVAAIAGARGPESAVVRAEAAWLRRDWDTVAASLKPLVVDWVSDTTQDLLPDRQSLVVKLAVAHARLGDHEALRTLQESSAARMGGSWLASALRIASAGIEEPSTDPLVLAERHIEAVGQYLDEDGSS